MQGGFGVPISKCPICDIKIPAFSIPQGALGEIACPNCGPYHTRNEFAVVGLSGYSRTDRALISGWVRDRWRRQERNLVVLSEDINDAIQRLPRLKPPEKVERFLLLLERLTPHLGAQIDGMGISLSDAWAESPSEFVVYRQWLRDKRLIKDGTSDYILTMEGWTEAQRLKEQRQAVGNRAFMAMQFGDERLDRLVANHFVPAVKAAGFDLRRLDEGQPAGLIDDQLRVRIRTARFMVSDITHGNNGTYWEAGYAEGLGRPVIYSCEKAVFDGMDKTRRAHFDTNHLVTVLWEPDKLDVAARKLKDIVRATFPDEARLED
jgi:hypothetical protein